MTPVKFKCLRSGNVISVANENDVARMALIPESYVRLDESETENENSQEKVRKKASKKVLNSEVPYFLKDLTK